MVRITAFTIIAVLVAALSLPAHAAPDITGQWQGVLHAEQDYRIVLKIAKSGAGQARQGFAHVPVIQPEQMADADAIIFGTPTRFGNMTAQMRNFLDRTGQMWMKGALIGKIGSVFTSTGTQHGGQETTITSFHATLLHQGMVIVGVPYSEKGLLNMKEITGGSPYGAGTLAGGDGSRQPSENELAIARFQGKHVAQIAKKLAGK